MRVSLIVVCESSGTAIPLARTNNTELLMLAAQDAITEKHAEARRLSKVDPVLGRMATDEANGLVARLSSFIPGLFASIPSASNAIV